MKRIILLVAFLLTINCAYSKEIPIKIRPEHKITTSNVNILEGDSADFIISEDVFVNSKVFIKKGQKVTGVITSIENNDYFVKPATIYIENFKTINTSNTPIKLKGIVYKTGSEHPKFTELFIFDLLRGGEVQIKPEKDEFIMHIEGNL